MCRRRLNQKMFGIFPRFFLLKRLIDSQNACRWTFSQSPHGFKSNVKCLKADDGLPSVWFVGWKFFKQGCCSSAFILLITWQGCRVDSPSDINSKSNKLLRLPGQIALLAFCSSSSYGHHRKPYSTAQHSSPLSIIWSGKCVLFIYFCLRELVLHLSDTICLSLSLLSKMA